MEDKRKHLDFIQAVISRLAGNSFLLKGWAVTLVSALFALSAYDRRAAFIIVAYMPVFVFWTLDAYYLALERRFRSLFDLVRTTDDAQVNFSMSTRTFASAKGNRWADTFLSRTELGFYLPLLLVMLLVMHFVL